MRNSLEDKAIAMSVRAQKALEEFKTNEAGDTNFISMLLIIGIVVVLATAFKTLAQGTMSQISQKVNDFVSSLG